MESVSSEVDRRISGKDKVYGKSGLDEGFGVIWAGCVDVYKRWKEKSGNIWALL